MEQRERDEMRKQEWTKGRKKSLQWVRTKVTGSRHMLMMAENAPHIDKETKRHRQGNDDRSYRERMRERNT